MKLRLPVAFCWFVLCQAMTAQALQDPATSHSDRRDFLGPIHLTLLDPFENGYGDTAPAVVTPAEQNTFSLECPLCVSRLSWERAKATLPAFASQGSISFAHSRGRVFAGLGGVNAWRPDDVSPMPGKKSRSFDDNWLLEGSAGSSVAVDRNRQVWLGGFGRYVENMGDKGQFGGLRSHWNTVGGTLNFLLGKK